MGHYITEQLNKTIYTYLSNKIFLDKQTNLRYFFDCNYHIIIIVVVVVVVVVTIIT